MGGCYGVGSTSSRARPASIALHGHSSRARTNPVKPKLSFFCFFFFFVKAYASRLLTACLSGRNVLSLYKKDLISVSSVRRSVSSIITLIHCSGVYSSLTIEELPARAMIQCCINSFLVIID